MRRAERQALRTGNGTGKAYVERLGAFLRAQRPVWLRCGGAGGEWHKVLGTGGGGVGGVRSHRALEATVKNCKF